MNNISNNLEILDNRERKELAMLLNAWNQNGLPSDFKKEGIHVCYNPSNLELLLVNSSGQIVQVDTFDNSIKMVYQCSCCKEVPFSQVNGTTDKDGNFVCDDCLEQNYYSCNICGDQVLKNNGEIRKNRYSENEFFCYTCLEQVLK